MARDSRRPSVPRQERKGEVLDGATRADGQNKDEIHLNTMFFDVFHMTRPYNAPKPFVFVIKRSGSARRDISSREWAIG
jgi:hypothetical protein